MARDGRFTPASERSRLEQQWGAFLSSGAAEGWCELYVPDRGAVPVEFSATANVLPGRHLSLFIPPAQAPAKRAEALAREAAWRAVAAQDSGQLQLTTREREVMTLVTSGLQTADMAERLFLSSETVKSHVRNAMQARLAHARACRGDRIGNGADRLGDIAARHILCGRRSAARATGPSAHRPISHTFGGWCPAAARPIGSLSGDSVEA